MDNEKDKLALVKYEPQPLTVVERLELYSEQKRRELQESLEQRRVADPFSAAFLTSLAVSAAITGASMLITTLLTPKQHLKEERGRRTGELVLNAELGILIPEVYFGMLSDGYGGSWVPAIIGWTSGIRKHVTTTTTPTGGGKFGGGGGGTTEVKEITYDLDWLLIWANKGPYRVLRSKANSDIIFDLYGQVSSYQGESASSYGAPYVISDYGHASGGQEVTLQANGAAFVQWNTVQSNGAATRQLSIYYRTSSNTVPIRVNINGGANTDITLAATNEVYLAHTIPVALNDGANTVKITNLSATFNIGIDKIYVFPGHGAPTATTGGTGVFNPTPGADPTYDPELPPGPGSPYEVPFERWSGMPTIDATGAQSGSMNIMGSASDFAIYPGNTSQLPDPTYEAAIDAQFGAGSTPAYRGRCYEVDANFYLTRWGGVVPNRIALLEHETIKKLSQMCEFMCSRVGMLAADYSFTDIETITPRGLRIMGTKFEAREPMTSAENVYDVVYAEQEGVLVGKRKSALISVATLTDEDFAWSDEEESSDGPVSVIDVIEPNEIDLPRRVDVKYVDLDRDGEPGLQGYSRQVTEGEESLTLDLQWTLTREEAQALAQKEVYRAHIEKPCRYVLSWKHLWINVGDVFTATLSDGFTYTILHAKDSGGIGVRECEGIILDEPIFDQSGVVDPYGYEQPVVPIPAMTITMLLDTPLLRDGDETTNNGVGFYAVGTPRTSDSQQSWLGYGLYIQRDGEWYLISDNTLPGTIGKVVSATDLYPSSSVIDIVFTADSTTDVLTSTGNLLSTDDEVTVGNTGGALPAPLVAGTSYFVRDKSGDTFKLAATLGGAAIDITSNGTGTNFINAGKIVVDLYGTSTLSSVTTAAVLNGANPALIGDMVFGFATATKIGGFPNRWQLTGLLNGLRGTDGHITDTFTDKRFVFLDGAVKFVPLMIDDLNVSRSYAAVTAGQSLDDAAVVTFTWTGNTLRPNKVSNVFAVHDASLDWSITFQGNPRPSELPESYAVEIWQDSTRDNPAKRLRTIPVTTGTSHAALLYTSGKAFVYEEDPSLGSTLVYTLSNNNNNILPTGNGMTVEAIEGVTYSRFDFTMQNMSSVFTSTPEFGTRPMVALETRTSTTGPYTPTLANAPLSVEWSRLGTVPGTVKEIYKSFGVEIATRDNVYPGETGVAGAIVGHGPHYTFLLSGTEYRVYVDYTSSQGKKPIAIVASPGTFPFPLRLTARGSATPDSISIRNITIGGAILPSTIYALRDQREDFGSGVFTVDSGTDVFTSTGTQLIDGYRVTVSNTGGGLPAPLVVNTPYYVRDKSGDTFKLSSTSGGAAINITSNGTGTNTVNIDRLYLRIYQEGRFDIDGIPFDLAIPAL